MDVLEERRSSLAREVEALEARLAPLQAELRNKQEALQSLTRFMELESGSPVAAPARPPRATRGFWSDACEDKGYHVGGDSAHRVMKRLNPTFHATVPHDCKLDRRSYP